MVARFTGLVILSARLLDREGGLRPIGRHHVSGQDLGLILGKCPDVVSLADQGYETNRADRPCRDGSRPAVRAGRGRVEICKSRDS
jgi:hypothetical protein